MKLGNMLVLAGITPHVSLQKRSPPVGFLNYCVCFTTELAVQAQSWQQRRNVIGRLGLAVWKVTIERTQTQGLWGHLENRLAHLSLNFLVLGA